MDQQFTDDDVIHSEDGEPYLTAAGIKKMCRLADEPARETASVHAEGSARMLARMAPRIWMRHNGQSEPAPLAAADDFEAEVACTEDVQRLPATLAQRCKVERLLIRRETESDLCPHPEGRKVTGWRFRSGAGRSPQLRSA